MSRPIENRKNRKNEEKGNNSLNISPESQQEVRKYNLQLSSLEARKALFYVMPLSQKISKRLIEDEKVTIYTSTMIFAAILFAIVVGLFIIYVLYQRSVIHKSGSTILDQGQGRGINVPKVVPPADSPEGQAFIEKEERRMNESTTRSNIAHATNTEPQYPAAKAFPPTFRYKDEYGNIIPHDVVLSRGYEIRDR